MPFDLRCFENEVEIEMLSSDEHEVEQPRTPTRSEEEAWGHAPQLEDEDELVEDEDDIVDDAEEPVPRELLKKPFGKKRPRQPVLEDDDEDIQSDCVRSRIGDGNMEDKPDLHAYFAFFENFPEVEQVKMCRAYATYLSARTPKNRLRYSAKSATTWNKK